MPRPSLSGSPQPGSPAQPLSLERFCSRWQPGLPASPLSNRYHSALPKPVESHCSDHPVTASFTQLVQARLDSLTKPPGSLGRLEALALRLAEQQQTLDVVTRPRRLVLFAA
ncbi:MAG: nicotinate-nucleotide--dimethylbenzimidazole phosphoribosyltransferase, partial [Planctomycetaceae bacterium]